MSQEPLNTLVGDAELVASVGMRLGRIKDAGFFTTLTSAQQALANNTVSPSIVSDLQKALNAAIGDISPITLDDLRTGWQPFRTQQQRGAGTVIFGIFSLLLLIATAYATQVYNRASAIYATTIELQDTRGAEQAIRLFGLLKKNRQDVIDSLTTGNKDFLYEAFNKSLEDLELVNVKFQAYGPIAASVLYDLDLGARAKDFVLAPMGWFARTSDAEVANPSSNPAIAEWVKNYGKAPRPAPGDGIPAIALPPAPAPFDAKNGNLQLLLDAYIKDVRDFMARINVGFDPLAPNDYSWYIYRLRESMAVLGLWMLPALYGMLGAVIFHMRRLLDPCLPSPTWLRFTYRIVLGGFAGIILVWFWTPSSQKVAQPAFATLTSFGLAFLVGFSTDVFFQALDRLVTYLSQAVGTAGA